uniref:BTB domain-containing protein n=1 Tax=Leptocylindrus danicus TaxID=163516 RepID=A0A7S2PDR2_9STRA
MDNTTVMVSSPSNTYSSTGWAIVETNDHLLTAAAADDDDDDDDDDVPPQAVYDGIPGVEVGAGPDWAQRQQRLRSEQQRLSAASSSSSSGAAPCQRSLHSAAVVNNAMYVFGGYEGQRRVNDFHKFDFMEKKWSPMIASPLSGPPPSPRDRHVSVAYRNAFYVFGGFDGSSRVSDFFCFDLAEMVWRQITPSSGTPPSPRHSHAAVVHKDSMYIFGGYDGSYRSDFHEFKFTNSSWVLVPAVGRPPRARYRATCVVFKDTMILFAGHDGTRHLADTHVFDFESRIWSTLVTEGPSPIPRDSHVSVVHSNSMYIFGGSTGSAMNDLHQLNLSHTPAKWSPVVRSGAPGHRFCHVAVVNRNSIYVFGGYNGSNRLNDFLCFDLSVEDLTCEVPPSTIISDLRSFVNNETFSDITLIVGDKPIYAHKIILMRCPYFSAMLLGEMMESTQSVITLHEVNFPIFMVLLEYLYTDTADIPVDSAMEILAAADQFCITRLKTKCENKMLETITIDNAAAIFHAADMHDAMVLKSKALKYIVAHFETVSKTVCFEEMARSNVELVFEILRSR